MENYDVVIVGAGPAGVGITSMLKDFGIENMVVLERGKVGETFDKWPEEMRFITPSFTTNFWAQMDLNSIATGTSPASGSGSPVWIIKMPFSLEHFS